MALARYGRTKFMVRTTGGGCMQEALGPSI